jgi:hypothetical protein
MVGNDKKSGVPGDEPSGAETGQDAVAPDSKSCSPESGGGVEGGGVVEGALVEMGEQEGEKEKTTDFVNYVCQRVGGKANVFQTVWAAMIQEAPAYLLDENKPIKLGFGELYAFPYRANWREIMQAKFPRMANALKRTPSPLVEPFLINIGWDAELFNSDLVEMKDGDKHHGWCIAFAPNEQWFKIVRAYEKEQRAALGAKGYARRFTGLVRRFTKRILRYFLNYVTQTSISAAAVRHSTNAGGDYLVPHIPKGKVRPTAPKVGPTHVVGCIEGEEAEERKAGALYGSFKEVPPLSIIPSSPKDLWERGGGNDKR